MVSSGPPFCSAGKIEPVDVFGHPVEVAADDAVADDELVAAPAVVRADAAGVARFRERAAEVREREGRDLVLEAELHGREVEGRQRLREREEVVALVRDLVLVRVVAALRDEEDLALQVDEGEVWLSLMTLATCFNWLPSDVFGNAVVIVGSVWKAALMSRACWVVELAPAIIVAVVSIVRRKSMEPFRATDSGVALKPLSTRTLVSDPVPIDSGRFRPMQNVAAPEIEVTVGKPDPPPLQPETASAVRPPQPVPILTSERPDCQAWIWSE